MGREFTSVISAVEHQRKYPSHRTVVLTQWMDTRQVLSVKPGTEQGLNKYELFYYHYYLLDDI